VHELWSGGCAASSPSIFTNQMLSSDSSSAAISRLPFAPSLEKS